MPSARHLLLLVSMAAAAIGCSSAVAARPPGSVAAAAPPKDDGEAANGGQGGLEHAAALEQLKVGKVEWRNDRQDAIHLLLPDAPHWTRVKFWGMKTLVGFRYGKDHHAVVAGDVIHVEDESAPGVCSKAFEQWAQPMVDAFEVVLEHDPPKALAWNGKIVDVDALVATTATLGVRDQYAVGYASYPAWKGSCVILGIAVPARGELERAKAVRDRFVAEVLPKVEVRGKEEPKERY